MYDPKNRRSFLRRMEFAELSPGDLYVGGHITVHARQLKIIDYADSYTRRTFEQKKARTLAIIKPDAYTAVGHIISAVHSAGFHIGRLKMVKMSKEKAEEFCNMQPPSSVPPSRVADHLQSDVLVVMELVGDSVCEAWREMIGPLSPKEARSQAPNSLRAVLGQDEVRNAVHGSANPSISEAEINFFFGDGASWPATALFNNCTLCIIRPHAVKCAGEIIGRILAEGFEISAMRLWHMDKVTAEEFLDVYKEVLPEYPEMCHQMCTGPSLVMEVRQEDAVNSFRKLVGPHDPEIAKHLRPDTIRSKFGVDRVRNAVHCTDLPEDGLLEVEYFFNVLYNR
jgi:nucleoside-diphosphate kinase